MRAIGFFGFLQKIDADLVAIDPRELAAPICQARRQENQKKTVSGAGRLWSRR
jgi:hypothetical protein